MRQAVLYFANWNLNRRPARKGEVCALPWDCATYLNHAFWVLEPAEGKQESSFARRAGKKPARTDWRQRSRVERRAGKKSRAVYAGAGRGPRNDLYRLAVLLHGHAPAGKAGVRTGRARRAGRAGAADVGYACAGGFIGAFADARLAQRL